jgi:opacity protein-like surface antigen
LAPNVQNISQANFKSDISYGVTATYNGTSNFGLEFMWNRQPTTVVGERPNGTTFPTQINANLDQYHGNILFTLTGPEKKLRPFILIGFGATHASGGNTVTNSATKFSFGVGGGVKYFFSEHVGVRTQIRYAPTYVYSTTGAIYCDWWGFCWSVPNDHYLQQGEVTGGLVFRF